MRLLFNMGATNYNLSKRICVRNSSRSIIIKDKKIAMVKSKKYNYYKFPGGGINRGESTIDAVIRETKEEAGLIVKRNSINEFGFVHRIEKNEKQGLSFFIQDNFYYLCAVEDEVADQKLDDYERDEGFTLEFIDPKTAIEINRNEEHGPKNPNMIERESKVLEILIDEGYFS